MRTGGERSKGAALVARVARRCLIGGVLLASLAVTGCGPPAKVPKDLVEVEYFLRYPLEQVRDACGPALVEYVTGIGGINVPPDGKPHTYAAHMDAAVLSQITDPDLIICTLLHDYSERRERSTSGKAEHWSILMRREGSGTTLEIYRHIRWRAHTVPISDGAEERGFVDVLEQALRERNR